MARTRVPDPSVRDGWIADMVKEAELPRALMGGTKAMQAGGIKWLPQHPKEKDDDWLYRKSTARLRNYFKRTVHVMAGKLFAKPFQVEEPIKVIQEVTWDVDKEGTDIQAFAKAMLIDALGGAGISFFLVDRDRDVAATAADDMVRAKAPYWIRIPIEDLISIRSEKVDGMRRVTHLRYFTLTERVINEFESEFVQQIKVVELDGWRTYEHRKVPRTQRWVWQEVERGRNTLGKVTLVPVYLNRTGFMMGENPLADLADMNLEHFQIRSEQRRILQINSFPILAAINYDGNLENINIGPNEIIGVKGEDNRNVDLKFVESQGHHLEAGRNEINDLVDQMRAFGAQFDKPGEEGTVESASGRVIDAKESKSVLQLWALLLKDSIELGLYYTDLWLGGNGDLNRVGKINMTLEFTHLLTDKDLDLLLKVRAQGDISRPKFLNVLKQNSKLPEDFNVDENDDELDDEAPDELIPPTGRPPLASAGA